MALNSMQAVYDLGDEDHQGGIRPMLTAKTPLHPEMDPNTALLQIRNLPSSNTNTLL